MRLSGAGTPDDIPLTRGNLLLLQQTVGNRQVARLLQKKGEISRPDDPHEREADRVAQRVVGASAPARAEGDSTAPRISPAPLPPENAEGGPVLQRQTNAGDQRAAAPAAAPVVEDDAEATQPGQMTKSRFLSAARDDLCRSVGEVLARAGRSTDDCPYLAFVFNYLGRRDARYINEMLGRLAPEVADAASAIDYIPVITSRARRSAEVWLRTGEITGLPEGLPNVFGSSPAGDAPGLSSQAGSLFFKAREGGPTHADDPLAIQAELGTGSPLDASLNSRMSSAFAQDFSGVRVHTDAGAARLSSRLGARAFTVGEHVAFGAGEFRPGTPVGDALVAHELAHVAQQRGAGPGDAVRRKGGGDSSALETDADTSAVGAVVALWGGAKSRLSKLGANALPRLKSGLSLQRCDARTYTPEQVAINELDSASFDENVVLAAFRNASQAQISEAIRRLQLRPHVQHANYYRYLLSLMNRDLSDEEWREFEGLVTNVAVTGEAPVQLSENARQLLTFIESQFQTPDIPQLILRMQGATAADLDAALTTLRRRYNREHGHDLHRLSSVVRENATDVQYRQFISLLHQSGITVALRETDPRIGVLVEQETQLISEGAQSTLTDEEMAGLFGTRALEVAHTMLRSSEEQLLRVMTRSSGAGAAPSQFDADIERARTAYGHVTRRVPVFMPYEDFAAGVRARLQAAGQTVTEEALRQFYDRERQIAMYRIAAVEQARIVQTVENNERRIRELRDIVSRPITYIGQHPLDLSGPVGAWNRREQAIRLRREQEAELRRLEEDTRLLTQQRQEMETALPLLGGLDVGGLQRLAALRGGGAEFDQLLTQALSQVFQNIERSRGYLQSGDVKIWLLGPVVEATRRQLGLPENPTNDAQRRWNNVINAQIQSARADERKTRDTLQAINAGLFIIALGTALFSGGGSLALYVTLTGTAVGVGTAIHGAIDATIEMREREATYGSGLTPETRLSDVPPDYEFLVYAWLAVGVEIGLAVFTIRGLARSGELGRLRGDAAAVRLRVQEIARRLRGRGVTASEQQLTESMMTALEERGWVPPAGGVRGPKNYDPSGNTGPGRLANNVNALANRVDRPRATGARFLNPSGNSSSLQYTLEVTTTDGRVIPVTVDFESVPQASLAAAGHGAEAGPARLILERDGSLWRARIQVAREVRHQDVRYVVGHELDEAARIVHSNPAATPATIAAEQEASLFRRDGSPAVTAHDHAAAAELRALHEDLEPFVARERAIPKGQPIPTELAEDLKWRRARLDRVMESMGLDQATNIGTKLRVLRDAGVSEDLIRSVQARWQQRSYFTSPDYQALRASSPNLRAQGSIMNEQLVEHLMFPQPQGGFVSSGLYGGHHTEALLNFTNRNPATPYAVVEEATRDAAGTTFRKYSQYEWIGGGAKPLPTDPRFPRPSGGKPVAGTHYDDTLWRVSDHPKTTGDSLQILMREADDAWDQWRTANPGLAISPSNEAFGGVGGVPPGVSRGGVQFSGFYTYNPATGTWTVRSVFIEAAWLP